MITLFENFNGTIHISKHIINDNGTFKIPSVNFSTLDINSLNINNPHKRPYMTKIRYNSLIWFYLYVKLLTYKGDNEIVLEYIDAIHNKDESKIEILTKFGNNNKVRNIINNKFKTKFTSHDFDDLQELKKLIHNHAQIFSDSNFELYVNTIKSVSNASKKGEKIVKGLLNVLYGRTYDIRPANRYEDIRGVDIVKKNKKTGVEQSVQVKNINGNVTFNIIEDKIHISNTDLDINNYISTKSKLPYDYVAFYLEKDKQVCILKSSAIFYIHKEGKNIVIKLHDWVLDSKFYSEILKVVDIPPKLLEKDNSKIFY
jgi:hypothetical protein